MRQASTALEIQTSGQRLYEITREVARWAADQGMADGLLTLFCRHTSASLLIQENAAPEVKDDIIAFFGRIAPEAMLAAWPFTGKSANFPPAAVVSPKIAFFAGNAKVAVQYVPVSVGAFVGAGIATKRS